MAESLSTSRESIENTDLVVQWYCTASAPFSNFYQAGFVFDEKEYPTGEHFYQSIKHASNPARAEAIRLAESIGEAHTLGNLRDDNFDSKVWESLRDDVMFQGMLAKFQQNEDLGRMLLETGDKMLVQIDSDTHWGMCVVGDGVELHGDNAAGMVLMRVREVLRNEAAQAAEAAAPE